MPDVNSITFRLESYLLQLSDLNQRWGEWLRQGEEATFSNPTEGFEQFESQAQLLMRELAAVVDSRECLLRDAGELGLPDRDLQGLARALPAWERPRLRTALAAAKQQLSSLRRLHVATWVLVSQRLQLYRDMISVLMAGTSQQAVYLPGTPLDGGGQLLDASL